MTTLTIPRKVTKGEELVIIPRKEYEAFTRWKRTARVFPTFTPTLTQKRALRRAREAYKRGEYLTIDELKRKLDITN